jgi:hypothetical protein
MAFWDRFSRCAYPPMKCRITECPEKPGSPPDGVIAYLTRSNGGTNVYDGRIINITASLIEDGSNFQDATDFTTKRMFHSSGRDSSMSTWLCYDFRDNGIQPTGYSIFPYRSYCVGEWILEISNDKSKLIEID